MLVVEMWNRLAQEWTAYRRYRTEADRENALRGLARAQPRWKFRAAR